MLMCMRVCFVRVCVHVQACVYLCVKVCELITFNDDTANFSFSYVCFLCLQN